MFLARLTSVFSFASHARENSRFREAITLLGVAAMVVGTVAAAEAAEPGKPSTPSAKRSSKAEKEPRPSEAAVLSPKTVVRADVAYGSDAKQRLDIYSPSGADAAPVVVFFHRGEWSKGDKSEVSYKPKFLNEHGIVFVSANYRLSPAASHPAHINDVATAVRWVYDHADEFGASPRKIVVMGHSCGCHLVTLLALDPRYLAKVGLRPAICAASLPGAAARTIWSTKSARAGCIPAISSRRSATSEAVWRDASPIAHVDDAKPLPPFLFVSYEQGNASNQAAERLAGLIRKATGRANTRIIEKRTHFTANHLLGAPEDTTGTILLEFVRNVTKPASGS